MGIEEFDHDHKQMFVIAGRLVDKVRDPKSIADVRVRLFILREGVQYLRGYFDEHAIREEAYMRRMGYADYALHKQLHDEFMANTLQGYEKMVERGTCSREEVLDFVGRGIGWLVEHISTADLAIVGRGTLGKPRLTKINAQVVSGSSTPSLHPPSTWTCRPGSSIPTTPERPLDRPSARSSPTGVETGR